MWKFLAPPFAAGVILALILSAAEIGAANPYKIFADIEASRLYLFKNGEVIKTYPCAGGSADTPSPIGTWKIIHKDYWGEGFGGRWMGFNVPWGKFGIHGTMQPGSIGWSSSAGCIRMYNKDVAQLFKTVPYGTTVKVEDGCFGVWGRGFRTLKPGMYGADVLAVQKRLAELGFFHANPNGKYGDATKSAVHSYQKKNNLYQTNAITPDLIKRLGFILME